MNANHVSYQQAPDCAIMALDSGGIVYAKLSFWSPSALYHVWNSVGHAQVLTAQYNNLRTSANLHETVLKPSNVSSDEFVKLFYRTVGGDVFAQPLYVPALEISGVGKRNVVFAATEHDSVYAFDVNGVRNTPLWTSFADPQRGITTDW